MSLRRRVVVASLAVGLLVLAVGAFRISPLWGGPALPDGATRLQLTTTAPHLIPSFGCSAALLGPIVVTSAGDAMVFRTVGSSEPVKIRWPSGWAAWRLDGRAELVDRDGLVVAREGDVLEDRFGGGLGDDDAFVVCSIGG